MGTTRLRNAAATAAAGSTSAAVAPQEDNRVLILKALDDPNQLAEIEKALPPGLDIKRFVRITLTALKANPDLLELGATKEGMRSLIAAIHRCAQMGLEPNTDLGHAYLIPFKLNGKMTLQFIIGYKGILAMARRSGGMRRLELKAVYANDKFSCTYGVNGTLEYEPCWAKDEAERGPVVAYYGFVEYTDGGYFYTHLTLADVAARRSRSANQSAKSPWRTDPVAMGIKSVARAMAPHLPLDAEQMALVEADEKLMDGDGNTKFIDVGVVSHTRDDDAAAAGEGAAEQPAADQAEPAAEAAGDQPGTTAEPVPPREGCTCGVAGDAPPSAHDAKCKLVQE